MLNKILETNNLTGIIALATIVSPVLVAVVNNIVLLISKHIEYKHLQEKDFTNRYYEKKVEIFTNFLDNTAKFLATSGSDIKILDVLSYMYQCYAYADKKLISMLDELYSKLEAWNNDYDNISLLNDCQQYIILVAKDINRILLENSKISNGRISSQVCKSRQRRNTK